MVALDQAGLPDLTQMPAFFASHWNSRIALNDLSAEDGMVLCEVAGATVAVSLMPVPIPWSELEGPCAAAQQWPEAAEVLGKHTSHLIVVVTGAPWDKIETSLFLTKVVAFVSSSVSACGIYWGGGTLVHTVALFADIAFSMSREYLPLYLWIDFRLTREDDGSLTLFTTGMRQFDFMEIEIVRTRTEPDAVIDRAFNIAHYLLDKGPILLDGHTIGMTMDEKIKVKHVPSIWDPNRKVYRLELWAQA